MAGGDRFEDEDDIIRDINVTPLVDITLVLLIIFMVTTTYIVNPSIKVDLPRAATAEDTGKSTLSLVLTREGDLYLNGSRSSESDLRTFLRSALAREGRDLQAVIAADRLVTHGRVVRLIDLIRSEGVVRFALNTAYDQDEEPPPPPPSPSPPPDSPARGGEREGTD